MPVSLKGRIKTELDRMLKLGVIVKQKEPTAWVNSMVTVVKSNGDVRICIDPKDLNKAISRKHYPMKTVEEVVANISNAKKNEVEYIGHIISKDGLKSDPEKVRAVQKMKKQENKKELKTFLGFKTYLSKFHSNMSDVSAPLRVLLAEKNEWCGEKE
ncbi:unnamed protein product [Mytilus coruscus]|uniref:Reverse transcriptase/retrotransposon-derived protein RNase H-like domain-containing protein n=1 Tax=Mytilus coruscus TaxID=42192 RepID=A0A6J8AMI5_MYTCO|nr:unnamed protein product [Mytilus coruscus]